MTLNIEAEFDPPLELRSFYNNYLAVLLAYLGPSGERTSIGVTASFVGSDAMQGTFYSGIP